MVHQRVRLLMMCAVLVGLVAGSIGQWSQSARAGDSEKTFTASAVLISTTGTTGLYDLPEPPGYPPAYCTGNGSTVSLIDAGPISVTKTFNFPASTQVVDVYYYVAQRLANGSYVTIYTFPFSSRVYPTSTLTPVFAATIPLPFNEPIGPDYVFAYHIIWYAADNVSPLGTADVAYTRYQRTYNGTALSNSSICGGLRPPIVSVNTSTGIVGSTLAYTVEFYPLSVPVSITWDGKTIGTVGTNATSFTDGSFKVPASTLGAHTVHWKYGHWDTKITYTVKSSIKLSPSSNLLRGQVVHVYLRGYASHETVNVRWIKNGSFVKIGQVTTSATGTANIDVYVPKWVPNGSTKVRGDGTYGHAQTNSVTVSGGPFSASTVQTPTATPTTTATPVATETATPTASPTAIATATAPAPTETPTIAPTELATETPAAETSTPTESPTPEPSPTLTPVPTDTSVPEPPVTPDSSPTPETP
jgi:hypothetical protein